MLKIHPFNYVCAGVVTTGEVSEKTGKPTTLTELCERMTSLEPFCMDCEVGGETVI